MRLIDIDKPIAQLNNLSLREVFEGGNVAINGDFSDGLTGWITSNSTHEIIDGKLVNTGNGANATAVTVRSNSFANYSGVNVFYSRFEISVLNPNATSLGINFQEYNNTTFTKSNATIISNPIDSQLYSLSSLFTTLSTTNNFIPTLFHGYSSAANALNKKATFDNIKLYNLTALGINLTKEQMDDYFAMYQSGVEASGFVQKTSANLESTNYIETTNGTFRSEFGDIVPVLSNQVINLKQNISGSHRFAIRFFDENMNQIQSGLTLPSYSGSTITYNSALQFWNNGSNLTSRNILVQINGNQGIHYVQMGVQTGNVAGVVSATDRLISQQIDTYQPYRPFALAKGIDEVAYGGKTYREIFEGGNVVSNNDFSDGLTTWVGNLYGSTNILSLVNGNLFITNAGNVSTMFAGKNPMLTTTVGHKYYLNAKMRVVNRNASSLELGNGSWGYIVQSNPFQNQWYEMSDIRTAVATTHDFLLLSRYPTGQQTTPIQEVDGSHGTYAINLTQLFGAGNEPDKATMDKLFQQYQEGGTVQAQAFIQTAGKDTRVIDAKLPYLNMMSIREVFESNLVVNGDFSDGTTGWVDISTLTKTVTNNVLTLSATSTTGIAQNNLFNNTNTFYVVGQTQGANAFFVINDPQIPSPWTTTSVNGQFTTQSLRFQNANITSSTYIYLRIFAGVESQFKNIHAINLTTLNLTHLTQAELDAMFALYQAGTLKLSDVFETGNLFDITEFTSSVSTNLRANFDRIENGYYFWNRGSDNRWISISNFIGDLSTSQLYYNVDINTNLSGNFNILSITTNNGSGIYSNVSLGDTEGFRITEFVSTGLPVDAELGLKEIGYIINLNTHNLQATTQTFMDDLFKAYQRYSSPLFIDKDGIAYGVVFVSKGD